MSYQQQRMIQPQNLRLTELLDAIRQEFDSMTNEASVYRMHKDEFDHKFNQQNAEMQQVRQMIYELEATHQKMKSTYEEEILKLKQELERGGAPVSGSKPQVRQPVQQQHSSVPGTQAPPSLGHSSTNVFGGIMSGQAPAPLAPPQQAPAVSGGMAPVSAPQQQQQQQQPPPPPPPGAGQAPPPLQGPAAGAAYPGYAGYPTNPLTPAQQQQMPPITAVSPGDSKKNIVANGTNNTTTPSTTATTTNANVNNQPGTNNGTTNSNTTPSTASVSANAVALGNNLGDLDIDKVPNELKKVKEDWFVLYNERAPRMLDVELVQNLEHQSVVCCVRFSFDGQYIATGCNKSAQIYDVRTGQLICKLQDDSIERDGDLYIRSVCFSPDGKYLATGAEDRQIRVWDIKNRTIRWVFSGHEQDIYSLDFSRNGRQIASGSGDRTVRMWDMETGQCNLTLSIEDGVTTVAISPDGRYVAAGSLDKTVRVWETSTGFLVERLEVPDGHRDSVYSVGFTPDGKRLVSGSLDKTIKLWELQAPQGGQSTHKGGMCIKTFVGHKDFVLSVASTPDSQWILSGSKDRGVQFWDPRSAQVQLMLQGHKNSVISVAPSPTGDLFATGSGDCRARIWRYFPRH